MVPEFGRSLSPSQRRRRLRRLTFLRLLAWAFALVCFSAAVLPRSPRPHAFAPASLRSASGVASTQKGRFLPPWVGSAPFARFASPHPPPCGGCTSKREIDWSPTGVLLESCWICAILCTVGRRFLLPLPHGFPFVRPCLHYWRIPLPSPPQPQALVIWPFPLGSETVLFFRVFMRSLPSFLGCLAAARSLRPLERPPGSALPKRCCRYGGDAAPYTPPINGCRPTGRHPSAVRRAERAERWGCGKAPPLPPSPLSCLASLAAALCALSAERWGCGKAPPLPPSPLPCLASCGI